MELVLSKEKLQKIALILLVVIGLTAIAFRMNWGSVMNRLPSFFSSAKEEEFKNEPALSAIEMVFAPGADQSAWEESVCAHMTLEGCQVFKAIYAKALFAMPRNGASAKFVKVVDSFDDGSQVWLITAVPSDGSPIPVYAHVSQNESGDWLLIRILFDQETEKYAASS
jgi:hypothetical protein